MHDVCIAGQDSAVRIDVMSWHPPGQRHGLILVRATHHGDEQAHRASVEFLLPVAYGYTPFANDCRSLAQAEFEAGWAAV